MDHMLVDILRYQRNLGNKNDGGWKSIADILNQSGFDWDGIKCMITIDNESAWKEYVMSHKDTNCFRFKVIPNWDDIVDLCENDGATGHDAETAIDANDIMSSELNDEKNSKECEVDCLGGVQDLDELNVESQSSASFPIHVQMKKSQSITSSTTPSKKKRIEDKDELAIAVGKIVESFIEYIRSSEKKIDVKEILNELNMLLDFDRQQRLKALKWLTENETQFSIVKSLPLDEKKKITF
ncbi:hypothetical protein CRYUN_Cryun24cG0106400 [Craigia yunnanensis]